MAIRYILPKDVHTLFSRTEGKCEKITVLHDPEGRVTFCNIVEKKKTDDGRTRYKIRLSMKDGTIKEGWTPGDGLDPVVWDRDDELLDGRFNF